jgi:hypothetical protein
MLTFFKNLSNNKSEESIEATLAPLEPSFRNALLSMYRQEPQLGIDGKEYSLDGISKISALEGLYLYELCLAVKPKATLEIGMAYGFRKHLCGRKYQHDLRIPVLIDAMMQILSYSPKY